VSRCAPDEAVETWHEQGWVVLEGLVEADAIDAALGDLREVFPTAEAYHADPEGVTEQWLGRPAPEHEAFVWPPDGPGFRPEQHRWQHLFPFPGSGALNRLCVHPAIVDFMERALGSTDLRLYQSMVLAKYTGITNYEQPMHTDRNHSLLPPLTEPPWQHVESFLYLSDVGPDTAPTHVVSVEDSVGRSPTLPLVMPAADPELYAAERPAIGRRGSLLAYRPDVFHRAVDLVEPDGARFLLNVSFKRSEQDWVGYHAYPSRANSLEWTAFVEASSWKELALFGFPPPGHPVWDAALLDATALRYPGLDLTPWRDARLTRDAPRGDEGVTCT
jgi:hypothetical protein